MIHFRNMACILAIVGVLLSGIPGFHGEDVNRDDVVDLRDAVIPAKHPADSATQPDTSDPNRDVTSGTTT